MTTGPGSGVGNILRALKESDLGQAVQDALATFSIDLASEKARGVLPVRKGGVALGGQAGDVYVKTETGHQFATPPAPPYVPQTHIEGLGLFWQGPDALSVGSGSFYSPFAGRILEIPGTITKTGLVLAPNAWYYVYATSSDPPDIEVSSTPPAGQYRGTARAKAGSRGAGRYLGAVRCGPAPNTMLAFAQAGEGANGWFSYREREATMLRVVSDGTATAKTRVDVSSLVPAGASLTRLRVRPTGAYCQLDTLGSAAGTEGILAVADGTSGFPMLPLTSTGVFTYALSVAGGSVEIGVLGYLLTR